MPDAVHVRGVQGIQRRRNVLNQRRKTLTKHGRSTAAFFRERVFFAWRAEVSRFFWSVLLQSRHMVPCEGIRTETNVLECSGITRLARKIQRGLQTERLWATLKTRERRLGGGVRGSRGGQVDLVGRMENRVIYGSSRRDVHLTCCELW